MTGTTKGPTQVPGGWSGKLDTAAVSVVLPAFNEADIVAAVLTEVAGTLCCNGWRFELLVVDDGSTDDTRKVVIQVGATIPQVRLVTHESNRGYGAAIRSGIKAARFPVTAIFDADGQYFPPDLMQALASLPGAAAVLGVRGQRADSIYRMRLAGLGRLLAMALLPIRVKDINCGLKVFRTDMLQGAQLRSSGGFISTELIRRVCRAGGEIRQLNVGHRKRTTGSSTGGSPRVILRILIDGWSELWSGGERRSQARRRVAPLSVSSTRLRVFRSRTRPP